MHLRETHRPAFDPSLRSARLQSIMEIGHLLNAKSERPPSAAAITSRSPSSTGSAPPSHLASHLHLTPSGVHSHNSPRSIFHKPMAQVSPQPLHRPPQPSPAPTPYTNGFQYPPPQPGTFGDFTFPTFDTGSLSKPAPEATCRRAKDVIYNVNPPSLTSQPPGLSEPSSSNSQLPYDPIADHKPGMAGQAGQPPMQTTPNSNQSGEGGGDLPKAFACSTCQKGFARRSDLVRHGKKERWCNSIYRCKTLTVPLERIHSGVRPHACTHPGCGKQFIQRSALTVHERVHTREKPHLCEKCGKVS